ncbi:MAG: hypothetical protein J0L62_05220 [Bacteroidetes bacterium]|nr:hypothetical protein [Bacteroidota bacterium]
MEKQEKGIVISGKLKVVSAGKEEIENGRTLSDTSFFDTIPKAFGIAGSRNSIPLLFQRRGGKAGVVFQNSKQTNLP